MPAVGKSTFARELAQRTQACLIDIDTSTEPIVRAAMEKLVGDPDDRDSQTFKSTFRSPIYKTLFSIADENLPHTDAIVTGPFTKELKNPRWPDEVAAGLATRCRVKCIFLHCDHEIRRKRMAARANPRDQAKLKDWDQHLRYYEPETFPSYSHVRVNTDSSNCLEEAIRNGLIG